VEEKSHISRMCGATPSGRIPTKLGTCVRLTDIIKRAKFDRYNLRDFGAVRCRSSFYKSRPPLLMAPLFFLGGHHAFKHGVSSKYMHAY